MECSSELFTEASGYLSSPEYPQPYPEDLRCNYSIRLQKGLTITLKFLEPFEIDEHQQVHCPYDQLKVLQISKLYFQPCCQTWAGIAETPLYLHENYGISTRRMPQREGLSSSLLPPSVCLITGVVSSDALGRCERNQQNSTSPSFISL